LHLIADEKDGSAYFLLITENYCQVTGGFLPVFCSKTLNLSEVDLATESAFQVRPVSVKNENELDGFLKKRFGSSCSVDEIKNLNRGDTFSVKIKGDGKDLGESKCLINYMYEVFYSPKNKLVVAFSRGQDVSYVNEKTDDIYDGEMYESFTFADVK
jgi:hypothetical protein